MNRAMAKSREGDISVCRNRVDQKKVMKCKGMILWHHMEQHAPVVIITVFFICTILSAILWPHIVTMWKHKLASSFQYEAGAIIESHQKASLLEEYQVNYTDVIRIRNENMGQYGYTYNTFGIDRRSGLSLQEYRDVYDGKW